MFSYTFMLQTNLHCCVIWNIYSEPKLVCTDSSHVSFCSQNPNLIRAKPTDNKVNINTRNSSELRGRINYNLNTLTTLNGFHVFRKISGFVFVWRNWGFRIFSTVLKILTKQPRERTKHRLGGVAKSFIFIFNYTWITSFKGIELLETLNTNFRSGRFKVRWYG